MSVKKIEERIFAPQNEVLAKKLEEVQRSEKIDNYALNMVSDNYGFGWIYAISGMVLGAVKIKERWCSSKQNCHCECNDAILSY